MTKYVEIAPGYGNHGVGVAREALASQLVDAIQTKLNLFLIKPKRVSKYDDRGVPRVRVEFDDYTTLYLDCWPSGPLYGFNPSWHLSVGHGGDLLQLVDPPRPRDWSRMGRVRIVLDIAKRILAGVTLVEHPQ